MSSKSAASDAIMSPWTAAVTEELLRETLTGNGWTRGWSAEGKGSRRPPQGGTLQRHRGAGCGVTEFGDIVKVIVEMGTEK